MPTGKLPPCHCGHSKSVHRQANHLRFERGACKCCECRRYWPNTFPPIIPATAPATAPADATTPGV